MRRILPLILILALGISARAQSPDTLSADRFQPLDSLLTQFYDALTMEPNSVKCTEMDNLIGTCRDSLSRQHVALQIYDHYRASRLMGEEEVAIYVYDTWFKTGLVKPRSEFENMDMQLFCNFNRSTLIGMKAPQVSLFRPNGKKATIPEEGTVSTLMFYDTTCAKCRLEVQVLPNVLATVDFPMNFYAVYAGSDKASWRRFRKNFKFGNRNVKVIHLWDPEMESEYQRLYGVISTPKMYVALEDGEIIGRRLEVVNLQEIIHYISATYGKETH